MVEKVYPGFAIVVNDGRFRARLDATSYIGPRDLIKEAKVFKALASIHNKRKDQDNHARRSSKIGVEDG